MEPLATSALTRYVTHGRFRSLAELGDSTWKKRAGAALAKPSNPGIVGLSFT
jgi:hypothetical protein